MISTAPTNAHAGAVRVDLDNSADRLSRERENTEQWFENETAALQQPVLELRGSLKSSQEIYRESINATQADAAEVKQQLTTTQRDMDKLSGRVEVIGNPITRPEMLAIVTTEVTAQVNEQAPTLVDEAVTRIRQDEFQQGWFGPRTDGERTRQLRTDAARVADQQQGLI